MNSDPRLVVLKSSNINEIRTRAKKIKSSAERISEECIKLKAPNNCNLYGSNLNQLDKAEAEISRRITLFSSAYKNFEDELSKFENTESQKISQIKIPKIAPAESTTPSKATPAPNTEPKTTTTPKTEPQTTAPKTEPKTSAPTEPTPPEAPQTEPRTAPSAPSSPSSSQQPPNAPNSNNGLGEVTISSPDVPKPQGSGPNVGVSNVASMSSATPMPQEPTPPTAPSAPIEPTMPTGPTDNLTPVIEIEPETPQIPGQTPTQPPSPPISADNTSPSFENIKDQVEIPVVEKAGAGTSNSKPKSSNDGLILAGGIAAIGGIAFGAVQGVQALEKKKEEEDEKKENSDGKFIIKNEGDK